MNNQKSNINIIGYKKSLHYIKAIFKKSVIFLGLFCVSVSLVKNKSEVKIGDQIWATNNLNVLTFRNGDSILIAQTKEKWIMAFNKKQPALCYSFDPITKKINSILYNYYAITDLRGLAPKKWHVATEIDWNILFNKLGGTKKAFEFLKLKNNILNISDNFGYRTVEYDLLIENNKIDTLHNNAPFFADTRIWSSSLINNDSAKFVMLAIDDVGDLFLNKCSKGYGCSLRCIKD